jgi:hypothetical protein
LKKNKQLQSSIDLAKASALECGPPCTRRIRADVAFAWPMSLSTAKYPYDAKIESFRSLWFLPMFFGGMGMIFRLRRRGDVSQVSR